MGFCHARPRSLAADATGLSLTRGFMQGHAISRAVYPVLCQTLQEIAGSVSFAMRDDQDATYLVYVFVPSRFTMNMVTGGSKVSLLLTAVGGRLRRIFCPKAGAAPSAAASIPYTVQTKTDQAALARSL